MSPIFYTIREVAKILRSSDRHVRQLIKDQRLEALSLSSPGSLRAKRLISADAIQNYIARNTSKWRNILG